MTRPTIIGVCPPAEAARRSRLFGLLEVLYDVRFERRPIEQVGGLDGLICFGRPPEVTHVPCPVLMFAAAEEAGHGDPAIDVRFEDTPSVDRRLRGQTLTERHARCSVIDPQPGDVTLAACSAGPLWLRRHLDATILLVAASPPDELGPTETLRNLLAAGRFLQLLPLTQFLRDLPVNAGWQMPPLRAAFIFDDPNLRASSYGHLSFPRLAEHARRHGYHAVIASIPLDYRVADERTVQLFRDHPQVLSLCIHGNNHERLELLRASSRRAARMLAGEALRRAQGFEHRRGLPVARVMCPPHEVCSDAMYSALFEVGFDAISTAHPPRPDAADPDPGRRLAECEPGQLVAGGLPLLGRHSLARSLDDVVLRAYLDQPLLLFGHHQDAADGLDRLAEAAWRINSLGVVEWQSLTDICRSNVAVCRAGSVLRVRLYSRRARLAVDPDVERLVIELPVAASTDGPIQLICDGRTMQVLPAGAHRCVAAFEGPFGAEIDMQLAPLAPLDPVEVPLPRRRWWPVVRRRITEGRDRVAPLRRRAMSRLRRTSARVGRGV